MSSTFVSLGYIIAPTSYFIVHVCVWDQEYLKSWFLIRSYFFADFTRGGSLQSSSQYCDFGRNLQIWSALFFWVWTFFFNMSRLKMKVMLPWQYHWTFWINLGNMLNAQESIKISKHFGIYGLCTLLGINTEIITCELLLFSHRVYHRVSTVIHNVIIKSSKQRILLLHISIY